MKTATVTIRAANGAYVLNVTAPPGDELAELVTVSLMAAVVDAFDYNSYSPLKVECEVRINE